MIGRIGGKDRCAAGPASAAAIRSDRFTAGGCLPERLLARGGALYLLLRRHQSAANKPQTGQPWASVRSANTPIAGASARAYSLVT